MEFRSIHTIETAENVHIKVELAGLASRVFAFGIDAMLMLALMGVVIALLSLWSYAQGVPEISKTGIPLATFVIFFGFNLFQEWLWNGRTVGKAFLGIRVVRDNGQPIGFWEAFGRNLLRVLDVYVSGIGLLCMMFNRREKRFGDFIAGTVVIQDQRIARPGGYREPLPEAEMPLNGPELAPIRMTAEEAELLSAFQARREEWFPEARKRLGAALCRYFAERWHQPVESEGELDEALRQQQQRPR